MDYWVGLLSKLTPFVASVAAILAWVAKIRWAKEYQVLTDAKVAAAESKALAAKDLADFTEKRFKALADFGPEEIKKYFEGVISLDKLRIAELQELLERANLEIQAKADEIKTLKEQAYRNREIIDNTEELISAMKKEKNYLEERLKEFEKSIEENDVVLRVISRPQFDMEAVRNMIQQFEREKRWILSPARSALAQKQAARQANAQAVKHKLAAMDSEEKVSTYAQHRREMDLDEGAKRK